MVLKPSYVVIQTKIADVDHRKSMKTTIKLDV